MNQKTKNIAVSETIHYAHRLNSMLAGRKVRETTEEALEEYWGRVNGKKGTTRDAIRKRVKKA